MIVNYGGESGGGRWPQCIEKGKRNKGGKRKPGGAELIFYRLWPLISPSSGHEIHIYL